MVFGAQVVRTTFSEVRATLPHYKAGTIFDVGANVGQTVSTILNWHQNADVFAFEPIASTFKTLQEKYGTKPNVHCFNLALGAEARCATMRSTPQSVTNRILNERETSRSQETVQVQRGDDFCLQHGIGSISILKVDTEGHDLAVLTGFNRMLGEQRVDFVQVEASMNPFNRNHVDGRSFLGYLEPLRYTLFGIFEQMREGGGVPRLRRANLAFISSKCVEANTPRP